MGIVDDMPAIAEGVEDGIQWKILPHPRMSHMNGYVRLPEGHPFEVLDYDDIDVSVHGGLTFSEDGWIGFDTAHAGDIWTDDELISHGMENTMPYPYSLFPDMEPKQWTLQLIVEETKNLAHQVKEHSN
jgi:hypothetical protein